MNNKLISIGKILNFHGIKGEVKAGFTAGKESLLKSLKQVFVFQNNVKTAYDIESVRFHKNFAIWFLDYSSYASPFILYLIQYNK